MEDGQLKVISPLVGTPAYRAGLEAGDAILEIDGKCTEGIPIDEAVKQLKGEAGTKVTPDRAACRLAQEGDRHVTREMMHVETVLGDSRKGDDAWDFMLDRDKHIGYIRITAFSRDTASEVEEGRRTAAEGRAQGTDPRPALQSRRAADARRSKSSDLFIAEGKIVSTKGRNTPERTWDAEKDGTFEGFPMVVLVNHYSASASEIVSACLQDHKRAVVIGERTWGKGSVQNVIELEGGKSALKLTTASYHRPSGKNIHRFPDAKESDEWGVMPDDGYEVKLNGAQTGAAHRVSPPPRHPDRQTRKGPGRQRRRPKPSRNATRPAADEAGRRSRRSRRERRSEAAEPDVPTKPAGGIGTPTTCRTGRRQARGRTSPPTTTRREPRTKPAGRDRNAKADRLAPAST